MKKSIVFFCMLLLCSSLLSPLMAGDKPGLPQKSNPPNAVNDFEGDLDPLTRSDLENKLRHYYDENQISFVIVTTDNFNGESIESYANELFRDWGIGKKGVNWGVLLVYSSTQKNSRIEVGYGLEMILTDAKCDSIIRNVMSPLNRTGQYSKAIRTGTEACLSVLKTMSPEDRKEYLKVLQAADDASWAKTKDFFAGAFIFICVLGLGWYIFRWIRLYQQEKKLRLLAKKSIDNLSADVEQGNKLLQETLKRYDKQAYWARTEAENHGAAVRNKLEKAEAVLLRSAQLLKKSPQLAVSGIQEAKEDIDKALHSFIKLSQDLWKKIQVFAKNAPLSYDKAQRSLDENIKTTEEHIQNGYTFQPNLDELKQLKTILLKYEDRLNNPEKQRQVCTDSDVIRKKADEITDNLGAIVAKKKLIDTTLDGVVAEALQLWQAAPLLKEALLYCRDHYPKETYAPHVAILASLNTKLAGTELESLRNIITAANDPGKDQLALAAEKFDTLVTRTQQMKEVQAAIQNIRPQQEMSQNSFAAAYALSEEAVAKALRTCQDSDVYSATKTRAKTCASSLNAIRIDAKGALVDWNGIHQRLQAIEQEASEIAKTASKEISETEYGRRKHREDEEERRQSSHSYTSSISTISSISSSGSDYTGGFSGFSGGDSGGAGASGW